MMDVHSVPTADLAAMDVTEVWMPVRGGAYEVSDLGRVRNAKTGSVKAQQKMPKGYRQVGLFKRDHAYVHRLVAEAFLGAPEPGTEVNHLDGDKGNNRPANLEWVTHSGNQRHAFRVLGTLKLNLPVPRGERNPGAKLRAECMGLFRVLASTGLSQRSLGVFFDVGQSAVSNILTGRTWRHVA